jgi:hypothetical protein
MRAIQLRPDPGRRYVDTCPVPDDVVARECESFLAGRWGLDRRNQSRPLPRWAWLDQVAHGDVDDLREAAARPSGSTPWRGHDIQGVLARAVLAAGPLDDLSRVQREVLVPLELRVMATVLSPRRAVELVVAAMYGG